jgi:hypothetical protein
MAEPTDSSRSPNVTRDLLNLTMVGLRRQEHLLLLGRRTRSTRRGLYLDMAKRKTGSVVELTMARHDIADYLGLT